MTARQNKHSGRIERKKGWETVQGALVSYRAVYAKACEFDNFPIDSKFCCFSENNPYEQFLSPAYQNYLNCLEEYRSGGYVGLKMS